MQWQDIIDAQRNKEYFVKLKSYIDNEYDTYTVYPPRNLIFNAFSKCKYDALKVVILGQDPYHGSEHDIAQAMGLAFSTPSTLKNPPSLVNILKEINTTIGKTNCINGDLTSWAEQGVLLFNTVLTVRDGQAHSHKNCGWEIFTDTIISHISQHKENIIFLLWGNHAKKKNVHIDTHRHYILTAPHPSPLSAYHGFLGCNHFNKTNTLLEELGKTPISW